MGRYRSRDTRSQTLRAARFGWSAAAVLAFALASHSSAALAQSGDEAAGDWIDTWSASPQPVWSAEFFNPVDTPRALRDRTVRQIARVSLGGEGVRVEFSNEYGDLPLTIGAAHLARAGEGGAIRSDTSRSLAFGGDESIVVPPGAAVWSDPVDLSVNALGRLAVSMYLPETTPTTTWHDASQQTSYVSPPGEHGTEESFEAANTFPSYIFLSGIAVNAAPEARSVVLFGDSITDGVGSTRNADNRWPDVLAERLVEADADVAVLNEGISGARVLRDRMGENALARFNRDVLSHPRADTVIVMMGINDIGWPGTPLVPEGERAPSADRLIKAYEQLIARAHAHGMQIIGATLTPFENTFKGGVLEGYYTEAKEAKRQAVNDWIRNSGAFDAVVDFDAATEVEDNPKRLRPAFDSGDHLHPNDTGYETMGKEIDLVDLGVSR